MSTLARIVAEARAARADGDVDRARDLVGRALAHPPDDLFALVDLGIIVRDLGQYEEANRVFQRILDQDADYAFAYFELGVSRMLQGAHAEALAAFDRLLVIRPHEARANLMAARLRYACGDPKGAVINLRAIEAAEFDPEEVKVAWEFGEYVTQYPRAAAAALARSVERDHRFCDAEAVAAMLRAALREQRGFSLVRLGDGEGAFLSLSTEDDSRYTHLYARNRADRARVWFNDELDLDSSGFTAQARLLGDVIGRADIVGVPYASWVDHEYNILSITGVSSLVNVLRFITSDARALRVKLGRQTLHMDLHSAGIVETLLREQRNIGLISCHPRLADRLKTTFDLDDIDFFKIPGEKLMVHQLSQDALAGTHYPGVFNDVMARLSQPLSGRLFLVAGGILGKFYCDQIKTMGGVALDVGSLVDRWVGAATRPGYGSSDAL